MPLSSIAMPLWSIFHRINYDHTRVYSALDRSPNVSLSLHPIHLRHQSHTLIHTRQLPFYHTEQPNPTYHHRSHHAEHLLHRPQPGRLSHEAEHHRCRRPCCPTRRPQKALEDQKSTLAQQKKEHAANQKTLEARDDGLTRKEKGLSADRKDLDDREAELAEKEHDQSARWDKKMNESQDLQEFLAAKQKKSIPRDSTSVGCGYKHYKPPRKINKKVIGLVYEK